MVEKLERGATVADVGCGHGASTIILAEAFPNSEFYGFDYHEASIEAAREAAKEAGVEDRITFAVASAKDYPGSDYDLVCVFDCLHDMGDPVGASAHVKETLADDGTWMVVEPYANDAVEENLNPVGRVFYGASTVICTPASLDQEVGLALGAQAGEARLAEVITAGGFSTVRRATETPFNLILEAQAVEAQRRSLRTACEEYSLLTSRPEGVSRLRAEQKASAPADLRRVSSSAFCWRR